MPSFEIREDLKFGFHRIGHGYSNGPNHWKARLFEIRMCFSGFQMVCDKMAAICPDFKWSGFQIPFEILTICKYPFLTIRNSDNSRFQVPTVIAY